MGLVLTTAGTVGAQETTSDATGTETDPRVIGGHDANPRNYPFYVMLADSSGNWFCGGTLIRDRWVLTAAHCADNFSDKDITVRFGVKNENEFVDSVQSSKIIVHPGWDWAIDDPDIALIRLARKPKMDSPLIDKTGFVARSDFPKVGSQQKVVGYGQSTVGGDFPATLQVGSLKVKKCVGYEGPNNDKDNICAGGRKVTACYGDSGGPLLFNNKVAGIVSYGNENCVGDYGVFTRVSKYKDWIRGRIKANRPGRTDE